MTISKHKRTDISLHLTQQYRSTDVVLLEALGRLIQDPEYIHEFCETIHDLVVKQGRRFHNFRAGWDIAKRLTKSYKPGEGRAPPIPLAALLAFIARGGKEHQKLGEIIVKLRPRSQRWIVLAAEVATFINADALWLRPEDCDPLATREIGPLAIAWWMCRTLGAQNDAVEVGQFCKNYLYWGARGNSLWMGIDTVGYHILQGLRIEMVCSYCKAPLGRRTPTIREVWDPMCSSVRAARTNAIRETLDAKLPGTDITDTILKLCHFDLRGEYMLMGTVDLERPKPPQQNGLPDFGKKITVTISRCPYMH